MSGENLAVVHENVAAFNRRDKAAWAKTCDPEVEWVPPAEWPEAAPVRGRDAVWDFTLEVNAPWGEGDYEIGEAVEVGSDKVVAQLRRPVRGKASGAETQFEYWCVVTLRERRLLHLNWFGDRQEAFEAAGLRA